MTSPGEHAQQPDLAWITALETLRDTPGFDVVVAAHESGLREVRDSGYLVSVESLDVGSPSAKIDIALYGEGCLEIIPQNDERATSGRLWAMAAIRGAAKTTVVCTPKYDPHRMYDPVSYPGYPGHPAVVPEIIELAGETRLLVQPEPHVLGPAGISLNTLRSRNLQTDPLLGSKPAGKRGQIEMHRAVTTVGEAAKVCFAAGKSNGIYGRRT